MEPKRVYDLDTPALLVDVSKLDRNIERMQATANAAGAKLRPHIKTHKCLEIAKRQLQAGAAGLTCAKISEAEVMSAVCDDLFVAYPIVGEKKFDRLDALSEKTKVCISIESLEGAQLLSDHLSKVGRKQEVLIKIETGLGRTGVAPENLETFLKQIGPLSPIRPIGLFTHEGKAYTKKGREEIRNYLDGISSAMREARNTFRTAIGDDPVISPGCTLTSRVLTEKDEFTEIRPGTYVFADTYCAESGVYDYDECALTVLVRIVAAKKDGRVVVDGGSKTFAMDRHPEKGHGVVVGHPDLFFGRLSEEHGVLLTDFPERYQVGGLLEVIPAHVCPAVNLHTRLNIRDGENLLDQWNIDARGCVT